MSGDAGLHDQEVIFYTKKMTKTKIALLSLKGIKFADKGKKVNGRRTDI